MHMRSATVILKARIAIASFGLIIACIVKSNNSEAMDSGMSMNWYILTIFLLIAL
jgi:hypothetical protein